MIHDPFEANAGSSIGCSTKLGFGRCSNSTGSPITISIESKGPTLESPAHIHVMTHSKHIGHAWRIVRIRLTRPIVAHLVSTLANLRIGVAWNVRRLLAKDVGTKFGGTVLVQKLEGFEVKTTHRTLEWTVHCLVVVGSGMSRRKQAAEATPNSFVGVFVVAPINRCLDNKFSRIARFGTGHTSHVFHDIVGCKSNRATTGNSYQLVVSRWT
mmetsp:Transcript_9207/g.13432  ORF Transcript_9207/g.13432 Transcript_9207/m.13432 type:complete len:212 (-) Transcript_9207:1794-2429(-)